MRSEWQTGGGGGGSGEDRQECWGVILDWCY